MKPGKQFGFLLILLLALILRIYMLLTNVNSIESDQAIIGLMALHILEGERPILYYGQQYYGPLDAYLTAPLIAIFGSNRMVIRIVPVLFSLAFIYVTYLLGKQLYSESVGWYSALYAAISPPLMTFRSLRADAIYIILLVIGNLSLILFYAWQVSPSKRKMAALIGLLLFGLWLHPLMGYYLLSMGGVWLTSRIFSKRRLDSEGASFSILRLFRGEVFLIQGSAMWYIKVMITTTIPIMFGLVVPPQLLPSNIEGGVALLEPIWKTVALISSLLILLFIIWAGIRLINQGQALLPIFFAITFFTFTASSIILRVNLNTLIMPRYLASLYSAIPFGVYTLFYFTKKRVWLRPVIMLALLLINLYGNLSIKIDPVPYRLLNWMVQQEGRQYIYTDYWTGYWLVFESGEKVIASIFDDDNQVGLNRYKTYAKQVNDSRHPQYVYFSGTNNEREFRNFLDASGITYTQSSIDRYVIYSNLSSHVKYPLGTP